MIIYFVYLFFFWYYLTVFFCIFYTYLCILLFHSFQISVNSLQQSSFHNFKFALQKQFCLINRVGWFVAFGGNVGALTVADGVDEYDDSVFLFLDRNVSLPVFLLCLSNMLTTGWLFPLTNVFFALFDESLYTGLPEMEISPSDVAFQIRPYHLNGVKIRMVWWKAYSCVSRRFENLVHSVHWSWLVHFT